MIQNDPVVAQFHRVNTAQTALRYPFLGAKGAEIVRENGGSLIDFTSGYGVTGTGWHEKELVMAMQRLSEEHSFAPPWMATREALDLSERLLATTGFQGKCIRATGGADAVEQIVKAVSCMRKGKFLCFEYAYHGGTTFTLALSDVRRHRLPGHHLVAEQPRLPAPFCFHCPWKQKRENCGMACAKAVERQLDGDRDIAAVIIEPILGSGGVIVPPEGFLQAVRESCRKHQVPFIVDEVMTGFGRAGNMCLSTTLQLHPDAIAFGKGLGAGYVPIGAALVSDDLARVLERFEDSSATFAWTPLACLMAMANLDFLERNRLCECSAETGARLRTDLEALVRNELPERHCEVRGKGLMIGLEFGEDAGGADSPPAFCRRVALEAVSRGLMLASSWDWKTLVILPPLTIDRATVDRALEILKDALRAATKHRGA